MYVPAHFEETDQDTLHGLVEKHPLGILVTYGASGLDANHLPFDLDRTKGPYGTLHCHVARNNTVWRDIATGDEVLVVFRFADAYISPNWYPSKHESHKQVPTWNYIVAHAHGRVTVHDDERHARRNVARLTRRHEAGEPVPWKMGDAPREFIDSMVKAIVALEIEITRLTGKAKLSQNKEARDIHGAAQALIAGDGGQIGPAMLAAAEKKSE